MAIRKAANSNTLYGYALRISWTNNTLSYYVLNEERPEYQFNKENGIYIWVAIS